MSGYYGTAVPTPAGASSPALEAPAPPALVDVVWCELAGCPASQCVHCRALEEVRRAV